ncbi:MAG: hypothetical protein H6Q84_1799 [Deltaproteobacteria bacterium]|nr:hypothetical protein [Deltaproteobacteria bacterium]
MTDAGPYRRIARRYFRAALIYLSLGAVLGALMLWFGNDNLQFLHGHMLLIGAALFAGYGAGYSWIAGRAEKSEPPGAGPAASSSLPAAQFWLANIGLPGMLLGSVLPVGLGLDRIGVLFGFMEAAAAVMFAVVINKTAKPGRS